MERLALGTGFAGLLMCTLLACTNGGFSRTAETQQRLERDLPVGMERSAVLSRLDSLQIPYSNLDSAGTRVRALVRNTSRSTTASGSLQVVLTFGADSRLTSREFRELFVAP